MAKIKYKGPEDHIVLFLDNMAMKFKKDEIKEVSEVNLPRLLANQSHKFEHISQPAVVTAEAKVLPPRGRNRIAPKVEVKDGSEL